MSIGAVITKCRTEKEYSKNQLAKLVGVSESTISRLEGGKIKSIKSDKLVVFAKVLNVPIETLLENNT